MLSLKKPERGCIADKVDGEKYPRLIKFRNSRMYSGRVFASTLLISNTNREVLEWIRREQGWEP